MCLYPKLIKNRKYTATKKNGGNIPTPTDPRVMYVPVGCQKCMECKKQKARSWSVRLQEEIKTQPHKHFITLTFSNESIQELSKEIQGLTGYELDNEIATLATRRFLERWRKQYGKSIKHWLVTEIGQGYTPTDNLKLQGDGNIHLHGIIFTDKPEQIPTIWKYGYTFKGTYVNESTVQYIVKYITKTDLHHKEYNPKILTSPGIGSNYLNTYNAKTNTYKPKNTDETYTTRQGTRLNLPIYYRNHIYTEHQREQLWLEKLDKQIRYINGTKISIAKDYTAYDKTLQQARIKNKQLGYGDDSINWERRNYENQRRNLNLKHRTAK